MESILGCSRNPGDDYYRLLGCDESASSDQILAEFRARVLDVHPDKNPENGQSEDSFKKLLNAKQVLTDPEKRKTYDRWRSSCISVPFEQWLALGRNSQMCFHWSVPKQTDLMLESTSGVEGTTEDEADISKGQTETTTSPNKSTNLQCDAADLGSFRWSSGQPSEALRKFRAYEI